MWREFPSGPPAIGGYTSIDHLDDHGACIDDSSTVDIDGSRRGPSAHWRSRLLLCDVPAAGPNRA
jgi:hypothetical protein